MGAVTRKFYDPDNAALGLYQKANQYVSVTTVENPFAGSRRGLGVGLMCFVGEGQVNGEPPTEYYVNENGYTETVQRSFDMYS